MKPRVKVTECDCCRYITKCTEFREGPADGTRWLCNTVCFVSMFGRYQQNALIRWEHARAEDIELMAWSLNRILSEIKGEPVLREEPAEEGEGDE